MSGTTFRKWLIDHLCEQLKHVAIIVSHTFLYLILLLMFSLAAWVKEEMSTKPEHPSLPPIIVIAEKENAPKVDPQKRPRTRHHRQAKKPSSK